MIIPFYVILADATAYSADLYIGSIQLHFYPLLSSLLDSNIDNTIQSSVKYRVEFALEWDLFGLSIPFLEMKDRNQLQYKGELSKFSNEIDLNTIDVKSLHFRVYFVPRNQKLASVISGPNRVLVRHKEWIAMRLKPVESLRLTNNYNNNNLLPNYSNSRVVQNVIKCCYINVQLLNNANLSKYLVWYYKHIPRLIHLFFGNECRFQFCFYIKNQTHDVDTDQDGISAAVKQSVIWTMNQPWLPWDINLVAEHRQFHNNNMEMNILHYEIVDLNETDYRKWYLPIVQHLQHPVSVLTTNEQKETRCRMSYPSQYVEDSNAVVVVGRTIDEQSIAFPRLHVILVLFSPVDRPIEFIKLPTETTNNTTLIVDYIYVHYDDIEETTERRKFDNTISKSFIKGSVSLFKISFPLQLDFLYTHILNNSQKINSKHTNSKCDIQCIFLCGKQMFHTESQLKQWINSLLVASIEKQQTCAKEICNHDGDDDNEKQRLWFQSNGADPSTTLWRVFPSEQLQCVQDLSTCLACYDIFDRKNHIQIAK